MNNSLMNVADVVPSVIKNAHIDISLEGWPAAAAIAACALCWAVAEICTNSNANRVEGMASYAN